MPLSWRREAKDRWLNSDMMSRESRGEQQEDKTLVNKKFVLPNSKYPLALLPECLLLSHSIGIGTKPGCAKAKVGRGRKG